LIHDNSRSSWSKFYFEIGVCFIILLAACFNYTNLTTARALTRAKEVGIRKVTGARRSQIFVQYVIESVLLAFIALGFAWILLAFIIEYAPFNDGYEFVPSAFRYNLPIVLWSIAFALFTGLLAGVAPASILSSFQPVRVLKNLSTARIFGKISIQKTLIVFQYSLSLVIIIFLFAFYQQFSYLAACRSRI
jgi:putative ABC transport system permease protein